MQKIGRKKAAVAASISGLGMGLGHLSTLMVVWLGFMVVANTEEELQVVAGFVLYTISFNDVIMVLSKKGLKMSNGLVAV